MPPAMDIAARNESAGLLASLQGLRRKVKLLSVFYGLGIVVAAAVGLLLAVVLIDYEIPLPAQARIVLNLAALGVVGYALVRWVIKPAIAACRSTTGRPDREHVPAV